MSSYSASTTVMDVKLLEKETSKGCIRCVQCDGGDIITTFFFSSLVYEPQVLGVAAVAIRYEHY